MNFDILCIVHSSGAGDHSQWFLVNGPTPFKFGPTFLRFRPTPLRCMSINKNY